MRPTPIPGFSPDGKRILYTTLRGGFPEIWLMNRDGSEPKFLTKAPRGIGRPTAKRSSSFKIIKRMFATYLPAKRSLLLQKHGSAAGFPPSVPTANAWPWPAGISATSASSFSAWTARSRCSSRPRKLAARRAGRKTASGSSARPSRDISTQVDVDGKNWEQLTFGADMQHDARYSPDGNDDPFL